MELDNMKGKKEMRCYNCNKIGHMSRDCHLPRKNKGQADKEKRWTKLNNLSNDD